MCMHVRIGRFYSMICKMMYQHENDIYILHDMKANACRICSVLWDLNTYIYVWDHKWHKRCLHELCMMKCVKCVYKMLDTCMDM